MTGILKQKNFEGCKDRTMLEGAIQATKLSPYAVSVFHVDICCVKES